MTKSRTIKKGASQLANNVQAVDTASQLAEGTQQGSTILDRLGQALTVDKDSFFEQVETKNGVVEVTKKVYEFANPIGKRTQITLFDDAIIESTEKIKSALHGRSILNYVICKEFSNIAESGKLDNMGFKNIAEYGKAIFGLESSTVNHYARIGKNFIDDDYKVKAGLPELSVSHFIELNILVGEDGDLSDIIEMYATGKLTDGMSTKKMRDAIKESRRPQLEDKSEDKSEDDDKETDESTSQEVTATAHEVEEEPTIEEMTAEFDSQIVVGQILNSCNRINDLFELLNSHEVSAMGYQESIDKIKALAKALIQ